MKIKIETMEENKEYKFLSAERKTKPFVYKKILGRLMSKPVNGAKFEPSKITYNEVLTGQFIERGGVNV